MKLLILLNALLFSLNAVYSQFEEKPSIIVPPPFLNISPNGTKSSVVETSGYDNIFLGVDLGEAYIATNPRDPLNSICAFNRNGLYYTLDGFNWTLNSPPFAGYLILGDPVMAYDSLGNCIYALLYQNGSTYGIVVMKTTNKGVSWIGPYNVYSTTAGVSDKEWITADQTGGPYSNNFYLAWRQFGATGMRFVRSTDGGVSWSSPLTFTGTQNAYVSVGPNGNTQGGSVYFAATNNNTIIVNRSTDGGVTFSPQVLADIVDLPGIPCAGRRTVKDCIRMGYIPSMAADNSYTSTRGNVYIVYCGNPTGPDNCDIYLIRSTDYGQTWSTKLRVNDDNTTTDQWLPVISADNFTGKVFVTWFDSRVDPANNLLTRIYGAVSTNGGISFEPNENISDVSFNPNLMAIGLPGGEKYIGDYIGNSAIRNTSYNAWMDGRNSNLGSYVGYYPDFALTINPPQRSIINNDSTTFSIVVPSLKGPFTENVRFTAAMDTLPLSGSLQISYENDMDSVSAFPDSVILKIKAAGNVTTGVYKINIKGIGTTSGAPVHIRTVDLYVNTSIGIIVLGTEIPNGNKLYQNFPNPFNPVTNINFDIIKGGNVRMVIYDLLGREVEILVNSNLAAGSYKVEFTADSFASGLYFYKIIAGEFTSIKKMVIVK